MIKNEKDLIKRGQWWQSIYNLERPHQGLGNLTPYEKLKSLGYLTGEEICLFPTLILDSVCCLDPFKIKTKSVQYHLDYNQKANKPRDRHQRNHLRGIKGKIENLGSGIGIRLKVFFAFFKAHQAMSIRNLLSTLGCVGSPGRTRTYNLVVTSYPIFLPDLDYLFTILTQSKIRCRAL